MQFSARNSWLTGWVLIYFPVMADPFQAMTTSTRTNALLSVKYFLPYLADLERSLKREAKPNHCPAGTHRSTLVT